MMTPTIVLISLSLTLPSAEPIIIHVSPHGLDGSTGRPATPTTGGVEDPFATPHRARDAIRELKRTNGGKLPAPVIVRLQAGTYEMAGPLVLEPEDSGTADRPITYEAAAGARVVLSGGRTLPAWTPAEVNGRAGWTIDLPNVRASKQYPHQLWIGDGRRPRARHPNTGFLRIAGIPNATPLNTTRTRFFFNAGDVREYAQPDDVEIVAFHFWASARLHIKSYSRERLEVQLTKTPKLRLTEAHADRPLARYIVENAIELLDEPGEWYCDRSSGRLSYLPRPGETPTDSQARVAILPELLRLEGKPESGRYVEHVAFRGLAFAHWENWPQPDDTADDQAAASVPAALHAVGARNCRFEQCSIAHGSGYGLALGRGCSQCRVDRCELFDLGAGGIKIGERTIPATATEACSQNVVADCDIHDGGTVYAQGVGIWIGQSPDNRIEHNRLRGFSYSGISVGWTWGYGPSQAGGNIIEANRIGPIGKQVLSDLAGVYTLGSQPGTIIRGNVISDIAAHQYGGWGIYLDEGSTGIVAENNLVLRTTHGGFHLHFGKDNVVKNNVFALGRDAQICRSRAEPHRGFSFERNIVFWRTGALLDGQWDDDGVALDRNLYWPDGPSETRFGKLTWAEWQGKGRDRESIVADPQFLDPAKDDYRLKDGSPASSLGFRSVDWATAGPRAPVSQTGDGRSR